MTDALPPISLLDALGILAGRIRRLDDARVVPFITLVTAFALPASILATVSTADRHQLWQPGTLLLVIAAVLLALWSLVFATQQFAQRRPAGMAVVLVVSMAPSTFGRP